MLTTATLGMAGYGLYAAGTGVTGLLGDAHLEIWAALLQIVLGLLLVLAGAFVRVQLPGGLALALGALLGLQALALHSAAHIYGFIAPVPQAARAIFAALLLALAFFGARSQRTRGLGTATDA